MPFTIWSHAGKYSDDYNDPRCYCKVPLMLQDMTCANCQGNITNSNRDNKGNPKTPIFNKEGNCIGFKEDVS